MQKSAIRICSAFALMGIALLSSIGLISAVFAENTTQTQAPEIVTNAAALSYVSNESSGEADLVLLRMIIRTDTDIKQILLYDSNGLLLQTLVPDAEGMAATDHIPPGTYRAVSEKGGVNFTLHENASVTAQSGYGWSDGEQLFLTDSEVGTLTIHRIVKEDELADSNGWLDYTLSDGVYYAREVVRYTTQAQLTCTFYGIPYGSYVLSENGVECSLIEVSQDTPDLEIQLP